MTTDKAIAIFVSYSSKDKEEFLAHLIHELTIIARDNYEVGGDSLTNPQRMRRINEIQHRVSAFLSALLRNSPHRYPDDHLVRIILEHPDDDALERQLNRAFESLANQHLPVA
jgi:tRNA A37 N6-isopentenylltransferase MiaA